MKKIALIGGGAIAEKMYLPACQSINELLITHIVDIDSKILASLKKKYPSKVYLTDYKNFKLEKIDGVIIATPNFTHHEIAMFFLERGVPVLIEKPMAIDYNSALKIFQSAQENNTFVQVGFIKRHYNSYLLLRQLVQSNLYGKVKKYEIEEGHVFNWDIKSNYLFSKRKAGGGVLIDIGVHHFDLIKNIFGPFEIQKYEDDCAGGVESESFIQIFHKSSKTEGTVKLSRLRTLKNSFKIMFEKASLEIELIPRSRFKISILKNPLLTTHNNFENENNLTLPNAFKRQLHDFETALSKPNTQSTFELENGLYISKKIQECYEFIP